VKVEVAYALPDQQTLLALEVADGTTAIEAVRCSGILDRHPELVESELALGVFSARVEPDQVLVAGDRVELYRPLLADPREVRRKLAAEGRTMGRGGSRAEDRDRSKPDPD
jgi:uncharacterized protein